MFICKALLLLPFLPWSLRFKLHLNDLSFLERIARTFTSAQVLIKSEVAASNTQARELFDSLEELRRKVDACANPSPDKEVREKLLFSIYTHSSWQSILRAHRRLRQHPSWRIFHHYLRLSHLVWSTSTAKPVSVTGPDTLRPSLLWPPLGDRGPFLL